MAPAADAGSPHGGDATGPPRPAPAPAHRIDDELERVARRHADDPPSLFPILVRGGRLVLTVLLSVVALVLRYGPVSLLIFPIAAALVFGIAFLSARRRRRRR